jgi:hypothetical protein
MCVLLLQDLLQSCARGGRRRVEDMCYERRRAEACVDESAHHALTYLLTYLRSLCHYNSVLDTDTGTGPIPSITVSGVNAYSGGVLARALPEGLRYLST